ncbi:sin3 histone deacetylase corepressor complex component SDS3 isoform X2 [Anastrepha obliqua]|uniref:sin3 histone deacetylase corepressor complex component SDS3 isoform X2 n=1 Tax=Anastrepha ludens TaxID=28586 RepID=UPI0023B0D11E|nr:sin3 histone deacetylase corepressor complex component SDS3 isoform X2 [Anastrepha ludens]XP_054728022.1 sin3 histone deacetylase corepressor complex component SDS3 isoform X2 [Anastrepha obliqua]
MPFPGYPSQFYDNYEDNDDSRSNHYDQNAYDSEEDTDDASETEFRNHSRCSNATNTTNGGSNHELKEQVYQHKLAILNKQREELRYLTHPDYIKRVKKLEYQCKERVRLNDIYREYLKECVEKDYQSERRAGQKEYEEKKIDLKENILADLEERKKLIENERYNLELTNDSTEIKPTITRKLRRRPNEPVPVVEKRRKPTTGQLLVYLLDEKEIEIDVKTILRATQQNGIGGSPFSSLQHGGMLAETTNSNVSPSVETRIEDGKLLYQRRWFHRGQQVYVEGKDLVKFAATITAIGNEVVWVKKTNDSKVKISMSHLAKGKVTIKRRAN